MRKHQIREIPEQAAHCLSCACLNEENVAARELLFAADAMTAAGVIAAIFLDSYDEHARIVWLARHAIHQQRESCRSNGPFRRVNCRLDGTTSR